MDIAPIEGLISLQNEFSGEISNALKDLDLFTKSTQKSLGAVAAAAGIVGGALVAVGAATLALGERGASVNDLSDTIEHFTGSARAADEVMAQLRAGTLGTVTNFDLASQAAHLLSANVRLSAEDFGTLGGAAQVLADRGLGSSKEMLDLVSDAMVTGKTKALQMALGVVDAGNAEEELAAKLGIKVEQLSKTGKAEAARTTILRIASAAVKDAGTIERDFGDQLEFSRASVTNWIDDLGSAVAESSRFKEAMSSVVSSLTDAFGGDQAQLIDGIVEGLEGAVSMATSFGIAGVETARVFHTVWSAIETVVLGVTAGIVGAVEVVTLGKLGLKEYVKALDEQAKAAAQGVIGNSEFDKTLDQLGGTLFAARDALNAARTATTELSDADQSAAENARQLKNLQDDLNQSLVDRAKVEEELAKVEKKSIQETTVLWNEYNSLRLQNSFSSFEAQKGQIDQWAANEVAKLDETDRNWKKHFEAIGAVAGEKLEAISIDWDYLRENSITSLQDTANKAKATYDEMLMNAHLFTREALEEQKQKVIDTRDEVRGLGKDWKEAQEGAAAAAKRTTDELKAQEEAAKKAREAAQGASFGFSITKANIEESSRGLGVDPEIVKAWARLNYSFEHAMAFARKFGMPTGDEPQGPGPRIPGFAEGGMAMIRVGERGAETVRVPLGSTVFPGGRGDSNRNSGGVVFHPGSIVLQYPIMNDTHAVNKLVTLIGKHLIDQQNILGRRM